MESKTDIDTVFLKFRVSTFYFLISCYCITNCLKFSGLKQYTCYLIVLMDQASGHGLALLSAIVSPLKEAVVMVLARDGVSSEAMTGEKNAPKLVLMLVRFISLETGGLRVSIPYWL